HLAGGSFKGMSRIAKSSPQMWESIFLQNKDNLLSSIDFFQQELERCKQMIQLDKNDELREWMKQANTLREIL
ncbi:prephenate dehydrogenase dimerization domain-containing protein, partial [Campylobacter jejuni]